MDTSTQSIQLRGRERRRFRTVEEKRRIVSNLQIGKRLVCWRCAW